MEPRAQAASIEDRRRWYAVRTRSRQEKVAAFMLESADIGCFLPLAAEVHRWSDRRKTVDVPLFPGYLFVCIENLPASRLAVLKVPGVIDLVRGPSGPAEIAEAEIESVRRVVAHGVECFPHPFLQPGDQVRILHGPLTGVQGTLVESGNGSKLILSIEMIQRSVAIHVERCDVEPVTSSYRKTANPRQESPAA